MNNELKVKRDAEVEEFNKAQEALEQRQKQINVLQQEAAAITNFLLEKKGRIEMLNEVIGPEQDSGNESKELTKED